MCGSRPKYTPPPPLPPPPQPARAAQRPHGGNEEDRSAERRRLYAGVITTPRGVLQNANLGTVLLGGGAPSGG